MSGGALLYIRSCRPCLKKCKFAIHFVAWQVATSGRRERWHSVSCYYTIKVKLSRVIRLPLSPGSRGRSCPTALVELHMRFTCIGGDVGVSSIATAIASNSVLAVLDLGGCLGMDDAGAHHLARALRHNTSLEWMDLSCPYARGCGQMLTRNL